MKKCLSAILSAALIVCLCAAAHASTVYSYDEWAAEPIEDGSAYAVVSFASDAADVAVPQTLGGLQVTAVAPHAFIRNDTMQSLTVTDPVTSLGEYACLDCTSLTDVTLPDALNIIGEGAFSGCTALTDINIEDTMIAAVEDYTFAGTRLSEMTLPVYCTRIGDHAFENCHELHSVTIPRMVSEIGESAFSGCTDLTIICDEHSYAAAYAAAHGIPCEYRASLYPYLRGDADGDNLIAVLDATRIQRVLARLVTEDIDAITMRGDVDGDGLNILDATAIQRSLASMGNPYGIGEVIYG